MGSNKKKVKTDQQKNTALRKKCVTLAKQIARQSVNYKCEYCGQGEPLKRTHGSHIFGEGTNPNMSADIDNILCLCATHHIGGYWKNSNEISWHESPAEMMEWFMEKYPDRYRFLKERKNTYQKIDWKKKLEELKSYASTK